jgi:hypothetical protein
MNLLRIFASPVFLLIILDRTLSNRNVYLYFTVDSEYKWHVLRLYYRDEFEKEYEDILNFLNYLGSML